MLKTIICIKCSDISIELKINMLKNIIYIKFSEICIDLKIIMPKHIYMYGLSLSGNRDNSFRLPCITLYGEVIGFNSV